MKVTAYRCDACNNLIVDEEAVGIVPQEDLFNRLLSWPTDMHPERCNIHYCLDCYREKVLVPASAQADRRVDERLYKLKLEELTFAMKDTIVRRVLTRKKKPL